MRYSVPNFLYLLSQHRQLLDHDLRFFYFKIFTQFNNYEYFKTERQEFGTENSWPQYYPLVVPNYLLAYIIDLCFRRWPNVGCLSLKGHFLFFLFFSLSLCLCFCSRLPQYSKCGCKAFLFSFLFFFLFFLKLKSTISNLAGLDIK